MYITVRKERAYPGATRRIFFPLQYEAAHGRVQEPPPGYTAFLGLKTLSKNHLMVTWQTLLVPGHVGGDSGGYSNAPPALPVIWEPPWDSDIM